jgi:thiamine biosynthesis lipoprotein
MTVTGSEHAHAFDCLGTRVRVLIASGTGAPVDPVLSALRVQARLARIHRALTRFDASSELSQLNARAGERVAVSPTVAAAIAAALTAAEVSGGLVDPRILPDLEHAGYTLSRAGVAPADLAEAIAAAPARRAARPRPAAEWRDVEVDPRRPAVRVPAGTRLDVGGTAKGLAVDLAAGMLAGHPTFAVDAGGDMRLGGTHARRRVVRIAHPLDAGAGHEFELADGAVATSGLRTRVWRTPRGFAHHLIDPARHEPAWTGVIQATALAATALEAETLAKTALLSGPQAGVEVLRPGGGALILDDGELVLTGPLAAPASGPHLPVP